MMVLGHNFVTRDWYGRFKRTVNAVLSLDLCFFIVFVSFPLLLMSLFLAGSVARDMWEDVL
jgi:hypothetical protein